MKRILLLSFTFLAVLGLRAQDTFSIIAVDPVTGEVGSAGASCVTGIGEVELSDIICDIIPARGGINAQALVCLPNPPFERVEQEVAALVKEYASKNQKIIFDSYSSFFVDTEQPPVPEPDPLPEDYVPPKVEVPLEQ